MGLGLSAGGIKHRVAIGRLARLHRGVYTVGHGSLGPEGRWLGAVLACGPGAVLSHRSAAALWQMRASGKKAIDVTAPGRRGYTLAGITSHGRRLRPADTTTHRGIPVTSPARTLLDLGGVVSRPALERALDQADALSLLDWGGLEGALARAPGLRGIRLLRTVTEAWDPASTRSDLERRFLALCRDAGLPMPRVNSPVEAGQRTFEADFCWSRSRLLVETDGRRHHATRLAFERDRRRDQMLTAAGWTVLRVTWRQIRDEPSRLTSTISALLAERVGFEPTRQR